MKCHSISLTTHLKNSLLMENNFHLRRCEISKDKHLYHELSVERIQFVFSLQSAKVFLVRILNGLFVSVNFETHCVRHALEHLNKVKILTFQL